MTTAAAHKRRFTASLEVRDLAVRRAERTVVAGVAFRLAPGEAALLRGANGSGKTSLLRVLAGLSPAAEGNIHTPRDATVYLGHRDGLKPSMTVAETLTFWRRAYRGGDVARAAETLDVMRFFQRRTSTLSAGQRRRVALCRPIISTRPIWLLDEPVSSLDAASRRHVERAIAEHRAKGGVVVAATHDPLDLPDVRAFSLDEPA